MIDDDDVYVCYILWKWKNSVVMNTQVLSAVPTALSSNKGNVTVATSADSHRSSEEIFFCQRSAERQDWRSRWISAAVRVNVCRVKMTLQQYIYSTFVSFAINYGSKLINLKITLDKHESTQRAQTPPVLLHCCPMVSERMLYKMPIS